MAGLAEAAQGAKTYVYVLRPISRLLGAANWNEADMKLTDGHFAYLKGLLAEGRIIIAGETLGLGEKTFGIAAILSRAQN